MHSRILQLSKNEKEAPINYNYLPSWFFGPIADYADEIDASLYDEEFATFVHYTSATNFIQDKHLLFFDIDAITKWAEDKFDTYIWLPSLKASLGSECLMTLVQFAKYCNEIDDDGIWSGISVIDYHF